MKLETQLPTTSIRFDAEDHSRIAWLKKKLGIKSAAGVVKHALKRLFDDERRSK